MNHFSNARRRVRLLTAVLGLGYSAALLAQPLPYLGRWLPDEKTEAHGTQAQGGARLSIDDARLSWRGPDRAQPACVQEFVRHQEKPGTVYANGQGKRFVASASGSFPTFLLKIVANACGGSVDHVRISFPLAYSKDQMELIEYAQGKPVSARRFHRKVQALQPGRTGSPADPVRPPVRP
jgi:hypothetical protein